MCQALLNRNRFAAAVLVVTAAALAGCQPCAGFECNPLFFDVGAKAQDLGTFLAVQRADEMAGGNAVLGQAGPLGRPGRVSLGLRVNRTQRTMPGVEGVSVSTDGVPPGAVHFPTSDGNASTLTGDIAVGVWRGVAAGDSYFGGIDLLGSVTSMQGYDANSLRVTSATNIAGGIGVRFGLLEETKTLPGISMTGSIHWVPTLSFQATDLPASSGGTVSIGADAINVSVRSWRLAASKKIGRFGITAGVGGDSYVGSAGYTATFTLPVAGSSPSLSSTDSFTVGRRNLFVGGSYTVGRVTVAGEYGHLSQSSTTYTDPRSTFGGGSSEPSRNYLTLGVRLTAVP